MRNFFVCLMLLAALASCGPSEPVWAPQDAVEKARYVHDGPPTVTLFTAVNSQTGFGGHSGLMINGSQRVLFDPAGSWKVTRLAERNDVLFGMTDRMVNYYLDYQTRPNYYVVEQTKIVSPEVAEALIRRVMANGAVNKGYCANALSTILSETPGFESVSFTWFPKNLMKQFAALPNVTTREITDDQIGKKDHGFELIIPEPRKTVSAER